MLSVVGSVNALLLSTFLFFKGNNKKVSDYFLGALLLMVGIRTFKSAFLFFQPDLFASFILVGLMALFLIGPFLFLYVRAATRNEPNHSRNWWLHIVPYVIVFVVFALLVPYAWESNEWRVFVEYFVYKQWLLYLLVSIYWIRSLYVRLFKKGHKLEDEEILLLYIVTGVALVYLAYEFCRFISYITGALSFSFLMFGALIMYFYRSSTSQLAKEPKQKYANSSIREEDLEMIRVELDRLMNEEKPFLDADLTLDKLSQKLKVNRKQLSQVINQTSGKNYSQFVAERRVIYAKEQLALSENKHKKIAAIAYDSGFNSLSSFNTYFKRYVGMTANEYRNQY